ncbi:YhhA family cyclophane-containing RiPP [Asticcacaulis benevestitus]
MQTPSPVIKAKPTKIDSVTLARLIDEVRNNDLEASTRAYDRVHNRHNR